MPVVPRLTFSAVFVLNQNAEIETEWFGRTIIQSDRRFSYEEVDEILERGRGDHFVELRTLDALAKKLDENKQEAGALTFSDKEIEFVLDENGKPEKIYRQVLSTRSHKLVEDFMLLANRRVAEFASKYNKNRDGHFVYRIHDLPDQDKLRELALFLKPLGYDLAIKDKKVTTSALKKLLKEATGKPEEAIINRATIQSMSRAIYSLNNIGHYGLAFPHYTHFTSPIRRYPDLMVHRLMAIYLSGKQPTDKQLEQCVEEVVHSSLMERSAAEAERESRKLKIAEYFAQHVGEEIAGTISGVTEFGLFVEDKATGGEGLIRISDLQDDYYEFLPRKFSLLGRKNKKQYRLGDTVRARIKKVNPKKGWVDLELI
jgi:ribonuclease R